MFVKTPFSFYLIRSLLGIAEAGLFPGVILYLTYWYPSHRRGKMIALFMAAQPISGIVGGPLSGWILQSCGGIKGLAGWQWLFLIEALPSIAMGIWMFFYLDDNIRAAKWLSEDQKQILEQNIKAESASKEDHSVLSVLRSRKVWFMSLIYFCLTAGLYGVGFWLPSIIVATGVTKPFDVGLLTMIPYGVAVVAMILVSRSADKHRERRWHLAVAASIGAMGLIFSTIYANNTILSLAGLAFATAGIITSLPLFWCLPTAFLGGTAAAAGIALINSVGNLAGFVSPYLVGWVKDLTHNTRYGLYAIASTLFLGAILTLTIPARLVNK